MKKFTVLWKHTCPHTTWGQMYAHYRDNRAAYGDEVVDAKIYEDKAGKFLDDHRMFMKVVEAKSHLEAQKTIEASACEGWGTVIFLLFEGDISPIVQNDLVIRI